MVVVLEDFRKTYAISLMMCFGSVDVITKVSNFR